jgi:hypothetical protein
MASVCFLPSSCVPVVRCLEGRNSTKTPVSICEMRIYIKQILRKYLYWGNGVECVFHEELQVLRDAEVSWWMSRSNRRGHGSQKPP